MSAIQLIRREDGGNYVLTPEGKAFLGGIDEEIAVVSVAGVYRSGKSTLLSMLSNSKAFAVGATTNACTMGIYCAPTLIEHNGKKILLVDSEGLDSVNSHADSQHDSIVFVLSLLIGSQFIYNATGAINDSSLNTMSLVVSLTKKLAAGCKGGVESIMPHLTWLARDFSLRLQNANGEPITPNQYLENSIHPTGNPDKDRVRNVLRASFPRRSCTTIIRPVTEESDLQGDILACPNLRPEFVEQMNAFRTSLFDAATVKKINGLAMTGPLMADMIESWLGGINKGGVPRMDDSWTALCQSRNMVAMKAATKTFDDGIQMIKLPTANDSIHSRLLDLKSAAIDSYKEHRFVAQNDAFLEELEDYVDTTIGRIVKQNKQLVDSKISVLLERIITPMKTKVDSRVYTTAAEFKSEFDTALLEFQTELKNELGAKAAAPHMSVFFLRSKDILLGSIDVVCGHSMDKITALQEELAEMQSTHDTEVENRKALQLEIKKMETQINELQDSKRVLQSSVETLQQAAKDATAANDATMAAMRKEVDDEREAAKEATAKWQAETMEKVASYNETIAQLNADKDALQSEKDALIEDARKREDEGAATLKRLSKMDQIVNDSVQKDMQIESITKELKKQKIILEETQGEAEHARKQHAEAIETANLSLRAATEKHARTLKETLAKHEEAIKDTKENHQRIMKDTTAKHNDVMKKVRMERDAAHQETNTTKNQLEEKEKIFDTLKEQYDTYLLQNAELLRKTEEQTATLAQRDVEMQDLQKSHDEEKSRFDSTLNKLRREKHVESERMQKQISELEFRVSSAESGRTTAENKLATLNGDFSKRFTMLDEELSRKRKRVDELEESMDGTRALVAEHPLLKTKCSELEAKYDQLETHHRAAKRRLLNIESEYSSKLTRLELMLAMKENS